MKIERKCILLMIKFETELNLFYENMEHVCFSLHDIIVGNIILNIFLPDGKRS